jgi:hypothetical protein
MIMAFVHINFGKPRDSTGMHVNLQKGLRSYSIQINSEKSKNSFCIRKKLGNPQDLIRRQINLENPRISSDPDITTASRHTGRRIHLREAFDFLSPRKLGKPSESYQHPDSQENLRTQLADGERSDTINRSSFLLTGRTAASLGVPSCPRV